MGMREFYIETDALGHGKLEIDGVDLSEMVQRVTLDVRANEPTKLYIETTPGKAKAIRELGLVFDRTPGADSDTVLQFLQNVDFVTLEAAAMEKLTGLDGTIENPLAAALLVLQEWAEESGGD